MGITIWRILEDYTKIILNLRYNAFLYQYIIPLTYFDFSGVFLEGGS